LILPILFGAWVEGETLILLAKQSFKFLYFPDKLAIIKLEAFGNHLL